MRYKNIVISGDVGTGTTTLARNLAKKFGWGYLSAGDFFRKWFEKNNVPLWNKLAVPDEVDKKIDYEFLRKMKNDKHIVSESHYGGWFARNLDDVFRILLICDKNVATHRILDRDHTHKETPEEIEKRRVQLREKFNKLYSSDDYEDRKYFHLIIDTTVTGEEDSLSQTLRAFNDR